MFLECSRKAHSQLRPGNALHLCSTGKKSHAASNRHNWLPGGYTSHITDLLEWLSCEEVGHLHLLPGFAIPSFLEGSQHCILASELPMLKEFEVMIGIAKT